MDQLTQSTLLSIQVGMPARHGADAISDKSWQSGIFKLPVSAPVWLGALNLTGDGQDDLTAHGGLFRAVLLYSADHYPAWRDELAMPALPYGAFGENFTISHLTEQSVCIGDIFDVGDVQIQVSQPRQPCWKLARRWGLKDLTACVKRTGRGGWYARVLREGFVEPGIAVTRVSQPFPDLTIARVNRLLDTMDDPDLMTALSRCDALTPEWREYFYEQANEA